MIEFWKELAYTTKFSAIAFVVTLGLGLISMGALGALLYYPVSFLFRSYPAFDDWHGDWVWPTMIGVGMLWSLGFVFGGISWHYLDKLVPSVMLLRIIYGLILWLWAALIWYIMIRNNLTALP
ncbi:MAG: hypothetical protein AB8H47_29085 [Bacteroidia bacterium]